MKFKENLEGVEIIKKSSDNNLFSPKTLNLLSELDKTRKDFWNVDNGSANFLSILIKINNSKNVSQKK